MTTKSIVIFDIDGTLANAEHRIHHVKKDKDSGKRNWKEFFFAAKNDIPYEHVLKMNSLFANNGFEIHLITGRPDNLRQDTQEWLLKHGVSYNSLLMRPATDRRPDFVSKKELFEKNLGDRKDEVLCVFEDRLLVCKMWREIGLNVVVCGNEWLDKDWSE